MRIAITLLVALVIGSALHAKPADGEKAMDALTSSPRHGEWVDVLLADGRTMRSWIVYPERAEKAPVVIVVHEIFGLTDWIRGVADAFAAEGYIAIAPDILWGTAPDGGGTASYSGDAVRGAIRNLSTDFVNARLDATRDFGLALPAAATTCGVVGFCWGGTAAFNYAVHQPKLDAAVVYYGSGPDEVSTIVSPVLGLYGGDDARVTSTVDSTAAKMKDAGKSYTSFIYDGAGHGFLRQQTGRDGANEKAAESAWAETTAFFRKHLEK